MASILSDRVRLVAGCMTGTSLDGLDVALVKIEGTGLAMRATFLGLVSKPLGDLADQLRHFAEGRPAPPIDYVRAARRLGELHADAVEQLLLQFPQPHQPLQSPPTPVGGCAPKLDFIVAHGQTIWHAPAEHLSWQLFDPWPLARRLKVPVCYDLRQADLIAGGQGAPITPIADWFLYGPAPSGIHAIINLGGIANGTLLIDDPASTFGEDICPCNIVIDGFVRACFPEVPFDRDGDIARGGLPDPQFEEQIAAHPAFARRRMRSLGRELFDRGWFDQVGGFANAEGVADHCVRAAVEVVARHIAAWLLENGVTVATIAGGGSCNRFLLERLAEHAALRPGCLRRSDDLGIPSEAREAMAFAILGALSQDGIPITLPQVTGAVNPSRAGAWIYP